MRKNLLNQYFIPTLTPITLSMKKIIRDPINIQEITRNSLLLQIRLSSQFLKNSTRSFQTNSLLMVAE